MSGSELSTEVLVVGGGPVGLTLAIDLGQRGVRCVLIDKRPAPGFLPKMERCNARSMEIYRRLGIADRIRAAGLDEDLPMDVFLVRTLAEPPWVHHEYPSVREWKEVSRRQNDGSHPAEPYQLISQYTLEPVLKAVAEQTPGVDVRFSCELVAFEQDDEGVTARCRAGDGKDLVIRSSYMAGCDGGSSTVRRLLGIEMEGEANCGEQRQALFRAPTLYQEIRTGRGRHYHCVGERGNSMVVQDDTKHFTVNARRDDSISMPEIFEELVGMPVDYELLYVGDWTMRLMVAERFGDRRVFIAGDSAHLVIPTGGLGMNTGVGDAIDLGWKLEAALRGWGGPHLLDSYELERRPTAERNVRASSNGHYGRRRWRSLYVPWLYEESERGATARAEMIAVADVEQRKATTLLGVEMGYRYIGSPLIEWPAEDGPDNEAVDYTPSTYPGHRLPHLWLDDSRSAVQDHIGGGFTILNVGSRAVDCSGLFAELAGLGVPVEVVTIPSEHVRDVYEYDTFLLRPDLHIVWRGHQGDDVPATLARRAIGALEE